MRNTLSLLLVKAGPASESAKIDESSEAWSEATKAISKKLRPSDSIFRLSTNVFALALPGTDLLVAKKVATRLHEGLQAVRAKYDLSFDITAHTYPEHVNNPGELEQIMKSLVPAQEVWTSPLLVEKA
jgi:GGDEF domain-containing protein